jgi:hypothetical protein
MLVYYRRYIKKELIWINMNNTFNPSRIPTKGSQRKRSRGQKLVFNIRLYIPMTILARYHLVSTSAARIRAGLTGPYSAFG